MSEECFVPWVMAESSSHPGRSYYFNRITKASTWVRPRDLPENQEIPSLLTRGKRGQKKQHHQQQQHQRQEQLGREVEDVGSGGRPLQNAWSQSTGGETSKDKDDTINVTKTKKREKKNKMASGGEEMVEAMEVERWGEEEEVAMDIDVAQEDIAEMELVRKALTSPTKISVESFGIPADYTNDYSDKLYLVLDTNVLLSHLNFLEELKDYAIKGVGKPVLVIPWAVMEELDNQKSRSSGRLAGKARKGIRLLFSCFTSRHPRVRCQTMEESQTEVHNMAIESNDDRILHCCLLYQTKTRGHDGIVVLFSNDLNLCAKAMGNGVKAADRTTLFKELRSLCQALPRATPPAATKAPPPKPKPAPLEHFMFNLNQSTALSSPALGHTPDTANSPPVTPFTPLTPMPTGHVADPPGLRQSKEVNDLVSEAELIVREALAIPLKQEMVNAFEDLWSTMVVAKPPWSLKDQLFLIDKHWIAVYGQVLSPHVRGVATQLYLSIRHRPGVLTVDEALMFVRRAMSLIQGFTSCHYCVKNIREASSKLNVVVNRLQVIRKHSAQAAGSSQVSSPLSAQRPTTPIPHLPPVAVVSPMGVSPGASLTPTAGASEHPSLHPSPSSLSLKEKLTLSLQTPPTDPAQLLEWVLGLVHDSILYSQSMVREALEMPQPSADHTNAHFFVRQVGELLSQIVTTLQSLLELGITIPRMQDVLVAFDYFLSQALLVNSPLTVNIFFELVSNREQRELLESALRTFTAMLTQIQAIDASLDH